MTSEDIRIYAASLGLDAVCIAPALYAAPSKPVADVCPLTSGTGAERFSPDRLLPGCQSVIVIAFPYYAGLPPDANLSLYTQGPDYHALIHEFLETISSHISRCVPDSRQYCCTDTAPLSDRWLAYQAGLGFFGDNHCLIHPRYGSYCCIGSILTTLVLEPDQPLEQECLHCGACRRACPGQCLNNPPAFLYEHCKSYLTQKKGSLSLPEIEILRKTNLIFGCDECQRVCPHNKAVPITPIGAFRQHILPRLEADELEAMTNRQFREAYGNRAFAWRGKAILLRNMAYITKT